MFMLMEDPSNGRPVRSCSTTAYDDRLGDRSGLERQRRVESRPQSGFYVRGLPGNELVRPAPAFRRSAKPIPVSGRSLMDRVYDGLYTPGVVPFGIANPCMVKPAAKALHRTMKRVMARAEERSLSYAPTLGEPGLRRQIAYRYLDTVGGKITYTCIRGYERKTGIGLSRCLISREWTTPTLVCEGAL